MTQLSNGTEKVIKKLQFYLKFP